VSDLADALRAEGYPEIANQLEQRELAERLRKAGRDDLADSLTTGETPPPEQPEPSTEPARWRLMSSLLSHCTMRRADGSGSESRMMPPKKSAHAQLDELRQDVANEGMRARDVESALEAAKAKVDEADRAVTAAYAMEDDKLAAQRRKQFEAAEMETVELQRRVDAAGLRVQHAQRQLDEFQCEHAHDLLDERATDARQLALELTRAGHEVIRLHRAYSSLRKDIDALVGHVPGASPRTDGPPASYAWEPQLRDLERAIREAPEVPALSPRWAGLAHRKQQDEQLSQHRTATPNVEGRVPS
jgi:hypothetical protein